MPDSLRARKRVLDRMAKGSDLYRKEIAKVELLGGGPLSFSREDSALLIAMPETKPNSIAAGLKITAK